MNCRSCKSELKDGQQLCSECGSWQNWRRHFNFTNSVVALMAGLVAILAYVGPLIIDILPKDDRLTVEVAARHSDSWEALTIEVENTSAIPMTFPKLFRCFEHPEPENGSFTVHTYQAATQNLIRKGEGAQIEYPFAGSYLTETHNSIDLAPNASVRCNGFFEKSPGHRIFIQFSQGTAITFWLEKDLQRYYP